MPSIRIQDCGHEFSCGTEQTLLEATKSRGVRCIRIGCLGGGCGVCKIRVLAGDYVVGKMSRAHVRVEAQAAGFALACKVTPKSDLVIQAMCDGHESPPNPWRTRRQDIDL